MFKLLGPHLLIDMVDKEEENKSKGGIYLAGENTEMVKRAKVINISPEVLADDRNKIWQFEIGQTIIIPKQCYVMEMKVDGNTYFTVRAEEIVGIEL